MDTDKLNDAHALALEAIERLQELEAARLKQAVAIDKLSEQMTVQGHELAAHAERIERIEIETFQADIDIPTYDAHCRQCLSEWGGTPEELLAVEYCPNCGEDDIAIELSMLKSMLPTPPRDEINDSDVPF